MTNCVVCTFKQKYPKHGICIVDETQGKQPLCNRHEDMRRVSEIKEFPDYVAVNRHEWNRGLTFYKVTK